MFMQSTFTTKAQDEVCHCEEWSDEAMTYLTSSVPQFLDILLFTPPAVASEQFLPKLLIIAAGFDGQRHGDAPAEQEHFLLRLEACQHAAQGFPSRETGEHGMDIVLVAEPAGDARPQLREDFVVNLRRALVDDQEGYVIFA